MAHHETLNFVVSFRGSYLKNSELNLFSFQCELIDEL